MFQIELGKKTVKTDRAALVMGIVNATPDSFFEQSRGGVERAFDLINQEADIIDIGGESTRPGFTPISADEEIKRIIPIIREIRKQSDIPISVDTTKLKVFAAAFSEGADIWNDVMSLSGKTSGQDCSVNDECVEFVAKSGVAVVLMHNGPGGLETVNNFLNQRAEYCISHGISKEKIIVDPGIGFYKTNQESIALIKNTDKICDGRYTILMALSRKRCIGEMTGKTADKRLAGTLAADMISVQKGAKIIRVHDVSEAIDTLKVMKYL